MAIILVIDDDQSVRTSIELVLKGAGHKVVLAVDGPDAILQFRQNAPDLVISDMYMPNKGGVQIYTELREQAPDLPFIAMSGNPYGNLLAISKELGAVSTLEKPFSKDDLLEAVSTALANRS